MSILLFIRGQAQSTIIHARIDGDAISRSRTIAVLGTDQRIENAGKTVIFELQGSLFFGTASQLLAALEPEIGVRKYVILSMRRVQALDVTATHVLEQVKDRLEEHGGHLIFCDIPKGLPSGLKMKSFLKQTGVVRHSNKAFSFRQLDDALEWIEAREHEEAEGTGDFREMDLREMPFLADQDEGALRALEQMFEVRAIKTGKRVFKANSEGDELFLIRRGIVKLTLPIHKKDNQHLETCGPGDIIGGMAFISSKGHSADALALTDTQVYALHRSDFDTLSTKHPGLSLALFKGVALNLVERMNRMASEIRALRG